MANEYITQAQVARRIGKVGALTGDEAADIDIIREAVSRAAENYLEVPEAFFIPQTTPTTRTVYGTRSSFLTLPAPLRGSVTITAPSGFTVPNFTLNDNRLVTLTADGARSPYVLWDAVAYQILGLWGYATIPPVLVEACLQWAVRFWRGKDEGFSGVIGGVNRDGSIIERSMPAPVRQLLDGLRMNEPVANVEDNALYIA